MNKLLIKLLIFGFLFFLYDKLFIIVAHRSAETEVDKRLEYLVRGEMNKDIIILGSSRGARGILAEKIQKETGYSAYNLCYPGSNVEFHEFILRTLLKFNNPPKVVLLVVDDDTEFLYDSTITFRRDRLYPLVRYRFIREELSDRENRDRFLSEFMILGRLNKSNFDLRLKRFTPLDTILSCGSMPISWKASVKDKHFIAEERTYVKEKEIPEYVSAYESIVGTCSKSNINLVVIFPPISRRPSVSFDRRIDELSGARIQKYGYNMKNPVYRDGDFFHDSGHLLKEGAEIFTSELITYLNDLINNLMEGNMKND